jgi:hypothetical protein
VLNNNILRSFSSSQWKIPFISLLLALGVMGEQTTPVLSKQIENLPASRTVIADFPASTKTPLLSRLRKVREQRSQIRTAYFDSQSIAKSNIVRKKVSIISPRRSKLAPSATLSKNVKTIPKTRSGVISTQGFAKEVRFTPRKNLPTKDGIYLYGQSPQANQTGQGYVLFQKQQDIVTGALYMPQSEFSCFQGTLDQSGDLAMTVTGSPDASSSTDVATANRLPRIPDDESINYAYSVALQDYHRVNSISANDRRILQTCNQPSTSSYTKLVK